MKHALYQNRTILITGASSGIGLEFARILCQNECTLVLTASRFERAEQIKHELANKGPAKVLALKFDLGGMDGIQNLCRTLKEQSLIPEIIINNAGRQSHGYFYKLEWEEEYAQVMLNCIAPMYIIHAFLPYMIKKNFGKILNVGSVAGTMPGPFFATYAATKAFTNSFSQSIHAEVRNKNIQCAGLLPSKTNCEGFWDLPNLKTKMRDTSTFARPEKVAKFGLELLERNREYGVYGLNSRIKQGIKNFVPRKLLAYLVYRHSYHRSLEDE